MSGQWPVAGGGINTSLVLTVRVWVYSLVILLRLKNFLSLWGLLLVLITQVHAQPEENRLYSVLRFPELGAVSGRAEKETNIETASVFGEDGQEGSVNGRFSPPLGLKTVDRKGILQDYSLLFGFQQGFRLLGIQTRRELVGPFFADYLDSVTHLQQGFWDGDGPWMWNMGIHPIQGATTYHMARTRGASAWESFWWTVAYTATFELTPLGEPGIGNVRISPVDLVVTNTLGPLLAKLENWLDSKIDRMESGTKRDFLRTLLPAHGWTNVLRGRAPWNRSPDKP